MLLGCLSADHGVGVQRVAALDLLDLAHHRFHELRIDRLLHQRAGRAGADFALIEERQHQAFGGLVDELRLGAHDVFEEDVRRLAAQFHGGRDDVVRRQFHDVRADRCRAGKGDFGDAFAAGQRFTRFAAITLHDVQHAGRQQVADQFDQHADAQRRLLGRFEHDAITGSQRRGEFPGGHQEREVPRDDLPDHAQRLMNVIGHGIAVDFGGAAFLRTQHAGEVAEMVGGQRNIGVEGFADCLAVIPGFGDGQDFQIGFDAIGNLQQDQRACLHRGRAPGRSGSVRSVEGLVDVFGGGARKLCNGLAGDRRGVGEILAFHRCDELAADIVTVAFLEIDDSAFGTGMSVTHDMSPGSCCEGVCVDSAFGHMAISVQE
ncbi:putative transcriptional regulator [Pseudomonas savastanoi pv. savastanoi]|nr:putative transcriptional regulator [Pseudomonas savastanoi pv. savastanoi]